MERSPPLDTKYIPCTFTDMQLADYMAANKLDDAAIGALIGRSRVTVSRYRRKLEVPSSETIPLIVAATGGAVTANDLLGIETSQAAE